LTDYKVSRQGPRPSLRPGSLWFSWGCLFRL